MVFVCDFLSSGHSSSFSINLLTSGLGRLASNLLISDHKVLSSFEMTHVAVWPSGNVFWDAREQVKVSTEPPNKASSAPEKSDLLFSVPLRPVNAPLAPLEFYFHVVLLALSVGAVPRYIPVVGCNMHPGAGMVAIFDITVAIAKRKGDLKLLRRTCLMCRCFFLSRSDILLFNRRSEGRLGGSDMYRTGLGVVIMVSISEKSLGNCMSDEFFRIVPFHSVS